MQITQEKEVYLQCKSAKINYSNEDFSDSDFKILPCGLVFQHSIEPQQIDCTDWKGLTIFFKTDAGNIPFDVFSAAFYLLSRYEEWLPYVQDQYGRFAATNSLAYQQQFLQKPLVQLWLLELESSLQAYFSDYRLAKKEFSFIPTYDIDIAYSYLHQPMIKNLYGFFRDLATGKFELFQERANVYSGNQRDPFDQFEFLDEQNQRYHLPAIYFFLLADKRKGVDKNIQPSKKALQQLIQKTASTYQVGIHPSWQSGTSETILKKEIHTLSELLHEPVTLSRQHYLKMTIPESYPILLKAGIKKDYTLGYGTANGFRASYAAPFFWYDLKNEVQTNLEIHPFCYMDANSIFELRQPVYEAKKEFQELFNQVKMVRGEMTCIFHNHFLTDQPEWIEWKKMYVEFLDENFGG